MNDGTVTHLAVQALTTTLEISMPFLLAGLVVGLAVSVFQAVTQIQEMTLTFVPKIVVMFVSLLVLLPFMLASLTHFTERLMDRIIGLG